MFYSEPSRAVFAGGQIAPGNIHQVMFHLEMSVHAIQVGLQLRHAARFVRFARFLHLPGGRSFKGTAVAERPHLSRGRNHGEGE